MPDAPATHPGRAARPPRTGRLSWSLVVGLGGLALLWPLAQLTGVPDAIGRPTTVLLNVVVVATVWVGGVGLSRVPPVLTLTLAGAVYGTVLAIVSLSLRLRPAGAEAALVLLGAGFEIVRSTLLGAVAGVLALGVQRLVGRTRQARREQ